MFGTRQGLRVGIEFRENEIRCAAVKLHGSTGTVFAVDTFAFDWNEPASVVPKLNSFVVKHRVSRARTVLGVPNHRVIVRYVQAPELPYKVLRQYIGSEIGTSIHLPFEDPVFDVTPVAKLREADTEDKASSVCLVAAPRETIAKMLAVISGAKLKSIAIETASLAIWRTAFADPATGVRVVVQHELNELAISLFYEQNMYLLRSVDYPVGEFEGEEAPDTIANNISYEVQRVVNFFNYNLSNEEKVIESIHFSSVHEEREQILNLLGNQLPSNVSMVEPKVQRKRTVGLDPRYHAAIGLGLRRNGS
jgi:type IV pilus assembly protein PilM